jgi:aryl-alcohol dehydrogenase-like predicted oxidoreductase
MDSAPLGSSGITVSRLALGSWRTFERLTPDEGLAVMRAAREAGITFFDDARYNDETGTAPIPTGWSEVLFGRLFRGVGWRRDEVIVSNKLWWEFWPEQSAAAELNGSLGRMGFDFIDVIYANPPEHGLPLEELVGAVTDLIGSGKARAWAIVNWPAELLASAAVICARTGVPMPCAAQLPYSVVQRAPVETAAMQDALAACGAPVVASYVLAGGVLTGKYDADPAAGRATGSLDDARVVRAREGARGVVEMASRLGTTPATLAVAFALVQPLVATVLFGATRPAQVAENVAALDLVARLTAAERQDLRALGT